MADPNRAGGGWLRQWLAMRRTAAGCRWRRWTTTAEADDGDDGRRMTKRTAAEVATCNSH